MNRALSLAESVVSAKSIAEVDIFRLMEAVAEIMEALAVGREELEKHRAGFSVFCAARTAWTVAYAAAGWSVESAARHAVSSAAAAARAAELLDEPQATWAIEAAHRDYLALLKRFGAQTKVLIGEPFNFNDPAES